MNRVGIIGHWHWANSGGCISYFSLYKTIEKLGYEPIFIEDPGYDDNWNLFLNSTLIKNKEYILSVKYKIKTSSPNFGFYLFDGDNGDIENVYMTSNDESGEISDWIVESIKFNPYGTGVDSIVVLSNQLTGVDNRLIIDSISISESNERWWFDESVITNDSNVAVYGYGDVGHDFVKQINDSSRLNLVGIVDANADRINTDFQIYTPDEINEIDFDYIIIAILNKSVANSVAEKIRLLGVDELKIFIPEEISKRRISF